MDVLSHAIAAMRDGSPRSVRLECHGPWKRRFEPVSGAALRVILQGSCWLIPPTGDPIALGVGDVVLLPHGCGHGMADDPATLLTEAEHAPDEEFRLEQRTILIGSDRLDDSQPTVMICGRYQFDRTRAHPLVSDLPEIIHLPSRLGQHSALRAAIELLSGELEVPNIGSGAVVSALLDMLLPYVLRAWYQEHGTEPGWCSVLHDSAISAVLCSIHSNPERQWTVEDLGAEAGLSRAAFARRFTALVGRPPLSYLTWLRMSVAAQLLRDSDAPLNLVAQKIGYTSGFAFANAFKREYGTAPGTYRRRNRSVPAEAG